MRIDSYIGIDEAGRGPLAGPVAVGGVLIKKSNMAKVKKRFQDIRGRDSKKLSKKKREKYYEIIKTLSKDEVLSYSVSCISSEIIDTKGIVKAIQIGIERVTSSLGGDPIEIQVRLDGGLKASKKYVNQKTIIKGDEKEMIISLASIAAKVVRDGKMVRMAKKYPMYGLERHKGYGTELHRQNISKYGISKIHRKTFTKSIQ